MDLKRLVQNCLILVPTILIFDYVFLNQTQCVGLTVIRQKVVYSVFQHSHVDALIWSFVMPDCISPFVQCRFSYRTNLERKPNLIIPVKQLSLERL